MLNRIEFVISEALVALSRNRLMTLAAVSTVAVALFLFGGMGYAYYRVDKYAQTIPGKFKMLVYMRDGATKRQISDTAKQIRAMDGVSTVHLVPKGMAWEKWKIEHRSGLTEGVDNPLPDALKVVLSDLGKSERVVTSIEQLPVVAPENGVRYMKDEQNFVEGLLTILRGVGIIVGGILFVTAGMLIYNAIRLTVLSRRLEIRIMQLVGASRGTVYIPFLIEGMLQGVIGAIVASGLVVAVYAAFNWLVQTRIDAGYIASAFPYSEVIGMLCTAGATYGILCSILAVRAPLKYR